MYQKDPNNQNRTSLTLFIAIILAVLLFIADSNNNRLMQRSKTLVEASVTPVLSVLSAPIRGGENFLASFKNRKQALEENRALKAELYQLRQAKERADIMAMKLARFEQILKASPGTDIPAQKIAARAVTEVNGPFVRAALINAGEQKGVKVGHPVMTVDGLYGHIVKVGVNSARVLRLSDLNSRIAVLSLDSQATAILAGNNSNMPEISFMSDISEWAIGDVVITSGDDGVLPRGLPIGKVTQGKNNGLYVNLYNEKSPIDWVWVYPVEPILAPEETGVTSDPKKAQSPPEDIEPISEVGRQ